MSETEQWAAVRELIPVAVAALVRRGADFATAKPQAGPAESVDQALALYALRAHPSLTPSSAVHEMNGDLERAAELSARAAAEASSLLERDHLTRKAAGVNANLRNRA